MQLTTLQLECLKLWADKSLSFGCLVKSKATGTRYRLISKNDIYLFVLSWEHRWEIPITIDEVDILWQPFDYGRLCYLSEIASQKGNDHLMWYMKIAMKLRDNPELIHQSILEWGDEINALVRDFLLSIQN